MVDKSYLDKLRHSAAHLLAAAVIELYPEAKRAIGPSIENGFYYDFDNLEISEDDLPKIEDKMHKIVKDWEKFERHKASKDEACREFKDNPYKLELIQEFSNEGQELTIYQSGSYRDLCRGGHIDKPNQELRYFKLLSIAGAYWRGDEKNKMLIRIYGTAFKSQKELDDYLNQIEEAKSRDHRKIGKDLGLFVFSDMIGRGLPLFTAKGTTVRRELERFIVDEELKRGYQHVITPPLAKTELYKTSGHYPYYKDTMYPVMKVDEDELILRPMTCPHHFMLYKSQLRSYRELPMRIAEISPQFRYEKSGELTGLIRVRMFILADAHIICKPEDAKTEIKGVLELIDFVNKTLGLEKGVDYQYRLSLGDRSNEKKYYKNDEAWEKAEEILRDVLRETNAPHFEAKNEAAFYGPKIDVQIKNAMGKEDTAFTIQYDFVMPKRFQMTYIGQDGQEKEVVVIHRASLGAFERTMAFLIEKYKGNFPVWLSPIQAKVLPVSEKFFAYSREICSKLKAQNIRVEEDSRNETLGAKIRDSQQEKVPYMLIVGEKEEKAHTVSVRQRNGQDLGQMGLGEIIKKIKYEIETKSLK